ncbi:hypothetical protein [Paracidovorax avenae]|uniref:hypothetical protein n=1 Tax=Paracidovorax avenae TaxID=80867 RepID=UPI00128EF6D9|nr:hypothetical protein [Paracidovorax avenae]
MKGVVKGEKNMVFCAGYDAVRGCMKLLTVILNLLRERMRVAVILILIILVFPVNAWAAEVKLQEGRVLLIAGGLGIILAIISIFMGVLKIIILRKFSLDKEWFDYSAKKAVVEISTMEGSGAKLARRLYVLLSGTASVLMMAMILVIAIYFIMGR